ncbi:MAG: prepilin-type N-terminal cleavage/methylation domain-containing protein [Sedimentisphaerales bacterium]|nr:prepilin-type N-terminal cleavage/methylation domain-containing protein [Sedimentisphaerales bacterium]
MCEQQTLGLLEDRAFRQSRRRPRKAFTVIELLVVVTVIALLMLILVPTLLRVRKQAAAVVCQSNLRQWALIYTAYTDDYDGRFWRTYDPTTKNPAWWVEVLSPYCKNAIDLLICPLAAAPKPLDTRPDEYGDSGDAFSAWRLSSTIVSGDKALLTGSYGHNHFVMDNSPDPACPSHPTPEALYWKSRPSACQAMIPVLTDAAWVETANIDPNRPPSGSEAFSQLSENTFDACINRHDGYVNGLFMDSHIRKIGLKELWTLKWHQQFDTAGRWTTAGGVKPENWPKWMRNLPDY